MKFEFRFNFNFSLINSVKFSVLIIFFLIPEFAIKVNTTEIVFLNKNKTLIEKIFKTEEQNPDSIKLSENNNFNQKFDKNLSYNNNNNKILNDKIESVITTDSVSDEIELYGYRSYRKPRKYDKNRYKYGNREWYRPKKTTATVPVPAPTRAYYTSTTEENFNSTDDFNATEPAIDYIEHINDNRCLLESAKNFLSSWLADNGTLINTRRVMGKRNLIKSLIFDLINEKTIKSSRRK